MTSHHLAQLNLADPAVPVRGPEFAEFVALLPEINALADRSPGFVWRLTDDSGADATSLRPFGPLTMVNMSVWESLESLRDFVYRSGLPTLDEAGRRLAMLQDSGPTPEAFTFRTAFPPPGTLAA
jgi:hypothetical protein